jgi:pilus assembly protein Flp/PilA
MITKTQKGFLVQLIRDKSGATAIEYSLIAALISIAIISGALAIGSNLSTSFAFISGEMVQ